MILNTYAALLALLGLLRLVLGLIVLGLGVLAERMRCATSLAAPGAESRDVFEDRAYLVLLVTLVLVGLNLLSWPLLYLLLQSYVPEWPGVMCIYGVTQIGAGSLGASGLLPELLGLLQWTKPLLVFAGGAWFVLYLLNRQTQTAPLIQRLFVALFPLGLLAVTDAAAELAYLGIPKREVFPSGGCCTAVFDDGATTWLIPDALRQESRRWALHGAYYAGNVGLMLGLLVAARRRHPPGRGAVTLLCAGGILVVFMSGMFLVEVAAPVLLHLPFHHCPYDLLPRVPEAVAAIALHIAGLFLLGWAGVASWLGRSDETHAALPDMLRRLLWMSLWGYLASLGMLSVELALA